MKVTMGGSYASAVRRTVFPEWLSMNALMGGMFPVMSILMRHDPAAMRPDTLRFWGVMTGAIMAGAVVAYPFNAWLVAHALKHGMGTANVLGRGGHQGGREPHEPQPHVTARAVADATAASLTVLAIGLWLAVRYGNL